MDKAGDVDEAVPRSGGGRCSGISSSSGLGCLDKTSCATVDVTLTSANTRYNRYIRVTGSKEKVKKLLEKETIPSSFSHTLT